MLDLHLDFDAPQLLKYCLEERRRLRRRIRHSLKNSTPEEFFEVYNECENQLNQLSVLISIKEELIGGAEPSQFDKWHRMPVSLSQSVEKEAYRVLKSITRSKKATKQTRDAVEYTLSQLSDSAPNRKDESVRKLSQIERQLERLSRQFMQNFAQRHKGLTIEYNGIQWPVNYNSIKNILTYCDDQEKRKEAYEIFYRRTPKNLPLAKRILKLRREKALLKNFRSYTHLVVETYNESEPKKILEYAEKLRDDVHEIAEVEREQLMKQLGWLSLNPWDVEYAVNKVSNHQEVDHSPYLNTHQVFIRMLAYFGNLAGLVFEKTETPTWHEKVEHWKCYRNNQLIGVFYTDLFHRDNKAEGDWVMHMSYRTPSCLPEFVLSTCLEPVLDRKQLRALLHEFGHLLHGLLNQGTYMIIGGLESLGEDLVEWPSQLLENFSDDSLTLQHLLRHQDTEQPMPLEYIDTFLASNKYHCLTTKNYYSRAALELRMHLDPSVDLETQIADSRCLVTNFTHCFEESSYSSRYYLYTWSEQLSLDTLQVIIGSHDRKHLFELFVDSVLIKTESNCKKAFRKFAGRNPTDRAWRNKYLRKST